MATLGHATFRGSLVLSCSSPVSSRVEASALKHAAADGLRGPTPLLRLQSDERLVALTRRGNQAAYEALVARYQARLLAFCRHMLGSREDAEDVLQEVFAAAYNAMVGDERPLNVRPWLYRIARNRSLNHLRRVQAIGVDSMDVHLSENGASTADKVHRREEFRLLVQDVQGLAETQRTALLLREIDALSYEQIAEAMETTVPSVKSLLVRARVSLAESAEARHLTCEEVRDELGEVAEGLHRTSPPVRRHLRTCDRCAAFRKELRRTNRALAAVFPVGPLLLIKKLLLANLGTTASAGGGAAAAASAGAGAASAGAGGALSAGVGAMASKAAAGLAAAAIVTAGAVEVDHAAKRRPVAHRTAAAVTATATLPATPKVVASQPQPIAEPAPAHHREAPAKKDVKPKETAKSDAKTDATPATPATPVTPAVVPPQQGSATVTLPDQQTADTGAADATDGQTAPPPPAPVDSGPADPPAPAPTPTQTDPAPPTDPAATLPTGDTTTQPAPPADDPTQQPAPDPVPIP
jgi:RNA polymerase sigma factor (sigma-70 family)